MNRADNRGASSFVLFILFVIAAALIGSVFVIILVRSGTDWSERAAMGEMLAGVGSILSVLSFGALLFTVFIQHRQYQLQRKELISARESQKEAAQALSKQIMMLRQ